MSKMLKEESAEADENLKYLEAEIASLKEELDVLEGPRPMRTEFVKLRIARLERDLPKVRERAISVKAHVDWHARMNQDVDRSYPRGK